jgi:hypothetical protein
MAKLYYEALVKILVDTGEGYDDRDVIEGKIAEQLTELHDIEEGTVITTDLQLNLRGVKCI